MKESIILLAEDDESQALIVKMNLAKAGISNEIIHFWHGGEVLEFLKKEGSGKTHKDSARYILLLDIRMPVVDGKEVLEQIKNDKSLRLLPVIMLTTSDAPEDIEYCYEHGCSAYIAKPVTFDKFKEAIKNLGLFIKVVSVPKLPEEK